MMQGVLMSSSCTSKLSCAGGQAGSAVAPRMARRTHAAALQGMRSACRGMRLAAAASAANSIDSYDGFDDGYTSTDSYEDAYAGVDVRKFVLKNGMVDFYELLGVSGSWGWVQADLCGGGREGLQQLTTLERCTRCALYGLPSW